MASDATEDREERATAAARAGGAATARSPRRRAHGMENPAWAAARRHGVALIAVTILYCLGPRLAPDGKWYGGADDVVLLIFWLTSPGECQALASLLDLPSHLRAVRRKTQSSTG